MSYIQTLILARLKINLAKISVNEIPKRMVAGRLILEIPDPECIAKADALASYLSVIHFDVRMAKFVKILLVGHRCHYDPGYNISRNLCG